MVRFGLLTSLLFSIENAWSSTDVSGQGTVLDAGSAFKLVLVILVTALILYALSSRARFKKQNKQLQNRLHLTQRKLDTSLAMLDRHLIYSRTDVNWVITQASSALARISGYSQDELIGAPLSLFRASDVPESYYTELRRQVIEDHHWSGALKHNTKSGDTYWVNIEIEPIFDTEGEIVGFTQVRHDITHQKRLEELWVTDQLTGLYNRHRIDELWAYEIKRSERYQEDLSIILIDLDYFKAVNDNYGHLVGDSLLYNFATLLKSLCRKVDIPGRWGGEEFIVLLPSTKLSDAVLVAEKIRQSVEEKDFPEVGKITASLGVSSFEAGMTEEQLFKLADDALYRSKHRGRNRVEVGFDDES